MCNTSRLSTKLSASTQIIAGHCQAPRRAQPCDNHAGCGVWTAGSIYGWRISNGFSGFLLRTPGFTWSRTALNEEGAGAHTTPAPPSPPLSLVIILLQTSGQLGGLQNLWCYPFAFIPLASLPILCLVMPIDWC